MHNIEVINAFETAKKIMMIISLIMLLISSISYSRIFKKMELPSSQGFFPIINIFITGLMIDMSLIMALLNCFFYLSSIIITDPSISMIANALLIPVNAMYFNKLAKAFGKSNFFGAGLFFLTPIFLLIMAFDSSKYVLVKEGKDNPNKEIDYASKTAGFNEDFNPYHVGDELSKNDEEKL